MSRRAAARRARGRRRPNAATPTPPLLNPSPPRSVAPSALAKSPVTAGSGLKATSWEGSFEAAEDAGTPVEAYTLKCVIAGEACSAEAQGVPATGLARPANVATTNVTATITGLTPETAYSCYGVASSAGTELCTPKIDIETTAP